MTALRSAIERHAQWPHPRPKGSIGSLLREVGFQIGALTIALAIGLGVIAIQGASPSATISAVWDGALGSPYAIQTSLGNAIPSVLVGGAVWLAYVVGLFNIGGEGQLQWGALSAVLVGVAVKGLPGPLDALLALMAGAGAGVVWASVPVLLRIARNGSEIIAGIMLNFVAILTVDYLVNGPAQAPHALSPISSQIPAGADIPVGVGFGLACVIVLIAILVVRRTNLGLRMRAVGANKEAAYQAGLRLKRVWLMSFIASGAVVGFAGALEITCVQHAVSPDWSLNWGLLGVGVAFLCIREPVLILGWGIVFGIMQAAGPSIQANTSVSDSVVTFILMLPVVTYFLLRLVASRVGGRPQEIEDREREALTAGPTKIAEMG